MFAKSPVAGKVKTRLAAAASPEFTLALYKAFVKDIYLQVQRVGEKLEADRVVFFSPEEEKEILKEVIPEDKHSPWVPQISGDLGSRMEHFFTWAFANGAENAILIGSDSPSLPDAYIIRSIESLRDVNDMRANKLVIGPSMDGGYYLIGMNKTDDFNVLKGIPWSTSRVLSETLNKHQGALDILPPWYDVDDKSALDFLVAHLGALIRSKESSLPRNTIEVLGVGSL